MAHETTLCTAIEAGYLEQQVFACHRPTVKSLRLGVRKEMVLVRIPYAAAATGALSSGGTLSAIAGLHQWPAFTFWTGFVVFLAGAGLSAFAVRS